MIFKDGRPHHSKKVTTQVFKKAGASGNLVRDFGAEIEFPTAKEDTIPVVFKVSKASR